MSCKRLAVKTMIKMNFNMHSVKISCLCRNFSVSTNLCKGRKESRARRAKKLMDLKEKRMKLKLKMIRKHPFNPNLPLTGKHVSPSRLGGSKEIQEKVALHVVQPIGYQSPKYHNYVKVPEMIPEFIVPDLTDFKLKPYVPYNAPPIYQSKFTAKALFDSCYAPEIEKDVRAGKITLKPSESSEQDTKEKKDDS